MKKKNPQEKLLNILCDELINSSQHDQQALTIEHYFVPFVEKWHNWFLNFSWEKRNISGLQHPN